MWMLRPENVQDAIITPPQNIVNDLSDNSLLCNLLVSLAAALLLAYHMKVQEQKLLPSGIKPSNCP